MRRGPCVRTLYASIAQGRVDVGNWRNLGVVDRFGPLSRQIVYREASPLQWGLEKGEGQFGADTKDWKRQHEPLHDGSGGSLAQAIMSRAATASFSWHFSRFGGCARRRHRTAARAHAGFASFP
jgi:hypothetical protein